MAEVNDSKGNPAPDGAGATPRRRLGGRRLLVASIGAATLHYGAACDNDRIGTLIANLMAPPLMPFAGAAGGAPPAPSDAGAGGAAGTAGTAGTGDDDAGTDDDAGGSE